VISKARIKDIKSLNQPKFRQMYNIFIAEGGKVCTELLKTPKYRIDSVFIVQDTLHKYEILLGGLMDKTEIISSREMEQISALKTTSDILLLLEIKEDDDNVLLKKGTSAIFLDGVQDPGNVGTIIRIADWYGIDAVIRNSQCADFFNPKVVQATMGSMANVNLFTTDYSKILSCGKTIYGTFMGGADINSVSIKSDAVLIMGSEGRGISAELEKSIQNKISIKGSRSKIAESLNVSVAAGIICEKWKGGF
jgi:TrmH family RNA methyltransferase